MAELILSEVIAYDPTSRTGLRWIAPRQRIHVGVEAGCIRPTKRGTDYWCVGLSLKVHRAHRIVWELVRGPIPDGMVIDHIDGDGLNNNIENLRIVTDTINRRNSTTRSDNSSGVSGVRYRTDRNSYAVTCYAINGSRQTKTFSCRKYGRDEAFKLATSWRAERMISLNSEGAGYTARHLAA